MWPRIFESVLACWIFACSFIFDYSSEPHFLIANGISALFVLLFALLSFHRSLGKIHLLIFPIALWMWLSGYTTFPEEALPFKENTVLSALFLLMSSLLPSPTYQPSNSWQRFLSEERKI